MKLQDSKDKIDHRREKTRKRPRKADPSVEAEHASKRLKSDIVAGATTTTAATTTATSTTSTTTTSTPTAIVYPPLQWKSKAELNNETLLEAPFLLNIVVEDKDRRLHMSYEPEDNYLKTKVGLSATKGKIKAPFFFYRGHAYKIDTTRDEPVVVRCSIPGYEDIERIENAIIRLNQYWDYDTATKTATLLWVLQNNLSSAKQFLCHWTKIHRLFFTPCDPSQFPTMRSKSNWLPQIVSPDWIRRRCCRRPSVKHHRWPDGHQHVAGEAANEIEDALKQMQQKQKGFWSSFCK